MIQIKFIGLFIMLICFNAYVSAQEIKHGTVITENLSSSILRDNRVNLDPNRSVKIYLPPSYTESGKSYPVVYYLHNIFWSPDQMFQDENLVTLMEKGFANGVVKEFILVVADYSTQSIGSLYENSVISGRWLDFTVKELVPFIDGKFRTLPQRDSRALTGDFFGGYGALKLAMVHADVFSVAYALHPVATGSGYMPWAVNPIDWKKIHQATSFADLEGDVRAQIFVTVSQGYLPNPERLPFYCDFWIELENDEPKLHVGNTRKVQSNWLLDGLLDTYAANLQSLRGLALDWGRYDPVPSHVYANQAFCRKLEDLGIEHEGEEYRGNHWDKNWTEEGRFYTRVLPFFNRHLVFE